MVEHVQVSSHVDDWLTGYVGRMLSKQTVYLQLWDNNKKTLGQLCVGTMSKFHLMLMIV